MADDPRPAKRVFVTVQEQEYELVATDKLTFPEAREVKRVSGGMAVVDLERGLAAADPEAWFAWIYISIHRGRPTLTVEELEAALGDNPLVSVIESVREEASEVADPDPPAQPSENASAVQTNGAVSGEPIPPLSTLATAGPRTSEIQD